MKPISSEQVLALLAEAPPRIAGLTAGLPPARLHSAPAADEWSANDVLAHLRACADVWGEAISVILSQDSPVIKAVNPRTWIGKTDYLEQEFHSSLRAYTRQRHDLMAVLEPLTAGEWARAAAITGVGKPLERTVLRYGQWMAEHERPHIKQIARIVSTP